MKNVINVYNAPEKHWVGDGFPVSSLFSYQQFDQRFSPFLLLDRAGPFDFTPALDPRGVKEHPHRGIETVTIIYHGEVAHRDSHGHADVIKPGDVQWMTAGAGILHEEFHSPAFSRTGGTLDMVQLWVNLPAQDKMTTPGYQAIVSDSIPVVQLPDNAGSLRVIAGDYDGFHGPARTFTAINVWDLRLNQNATVKLSVNKAWYTMVVVLHGSVQVNNETFIRETQTALLDQAGSDFMLSATNDAIVLLLSGEPIDEPIVGYGPFVMNSQAEIDQAISDYKNGLFGQMPR